MSPSNVPQSSGSPQARTPCPGAGRGPSMSHLCCRARCGCARCCPGSAPWRSGTRPGCCGGRRCPHPGVCGHFLLSTPYRAMPTWAVVPAGKEGAPSGKPTRGAAGPPALPVTALSTNPAPEHKLCACLLLGKIQNKVMGPGRQQKDPSKWPARQERVRSEEQSQPLQPQSSQG